MFNSIHVVSSWDFCGGLEIHDHDQKSAAALLPFLCHFVLGDFRQCILFSHSLLVHLSTLHKCALVWCILANCDSNYIQPYEYPSIATGVLSESHYGAKLYLAWPALPAFPLCIRYYFARLLLLSYQPSLGLFNTSTYTNRHAVQSNTRYPRTTTTTIPPI